MKDGVIIDHKRVTEAILGHCVCRGDEALSWYPVEAMVKQEERFEVIFSCVCAKCGLTVQRTPRP